MKILVISNNFPTLYSPISGPFVKRFASDLVRQGHEVEVVAPISWVSQLKRGWQQAAEGQIEFPLHIPFYTSFPLSYFKRWKSYFAHKNDIYFASAVKRAVKNRTQQFDLCYAHFLPSGRAALMAVPGLPVFLAMGESDPWIYDELYGDQWVEELHHFAGVITVSQTLKDYLIERCPSLEAVTHNVPNGVDTDIHLPLDQNSCRQELRLPLDETIIAFVGSFDTRKGIKLVEEACRMLNIKGVFLGEGKYKPAHTVALFAGRVTAAEVKKYLGAADCFVLPSLSEGRSNAVLEALAMGKVCVVSNRKFNTEFLDESNAILIDPKSVDSIAQGIKLGLQPCVRRKLEKAARGVAMRLNQEQRVEKISRIFENIKSS